ncbi:cilium assembly protein DZIP1 isoform 2-T2 [Menidia menidia]
MPFQDGVYYPYTSDAQGTHSSAGIPSLLNSPLSQPSLNGHAASAPGMTPSSGASAALPFKFRPRRESVDWRRINAVDIDLVVSQLDVDALQEHISTVTFCSLEGERCQRCQSPVDPALLKLLQLAQLTVEWLLHCQEFLSLNLRAAEERLLAAGREREQLLGQQKKQEDKVKELTAELKQRKKVIRTQQSLLAPRIISSQKNHMQRRHPDEYQTQLQSDSEKKSQIDSLKSEISGLKEQIVQQQQALQAKVAQEKEQQSLHKDLLRELERFKAEEMARMDRKIEDSRDGMRREMEFLYNRNIQALNDVNQSQSARQEKAVSPVSSQPERDVDVYKEMQLQVVQKLQQQMKKQDRKWQSMLQELKTQHESEKNQLLDELSKMRSSLSEHQERSQRQQQEMGRRLQEKEQTIKAQREQIRTVTSNPPTTVVEIPVVAASVPEPKPKRVVLEEPASALKLEPIQELSEEEKDSSSSISERRRTEKKPEPLGEKKQRSTAGVLKINNPNIKREMRPEIEHTLIRKLESLGVKPDQSGLKNKELTSVLAKMRSKSAAKTTPEYWRRREEISSALEQKLGADPAVQPKARPKPPVQVLQIRPRSSSLPSRGSHVASGPAVKQPKTPQPAPRTRTSAQPKTSTPVTKTAFTSKTPPFSSDEESEEEEESSDTEEEQEPKQQRGTSSKSRLNQATPVQIRANKASLVLTRQAAVGHPSAARPQQPWAPAAAVTRTAVSKMESEEEEEEEEEEWSDISELQEIDPKELQVYKDQNGNVEKKRHGKENKISELARKMEKQFADRATKKPAGGVSVLPEKKDEVQELSFTDLEESSDWLVSSLEDKQLSVPQRKSLDTPSTSVWGTSTGKGPRSGLTEAGTGSTLKSSLCSLSDISDSEQ